MPQKLTEHRMRSQVNESTADVSHQQAKPKQRSVPEKKITYGAAGKRRCLGGGDPASTHTIRPFAADH